jgi:hypothetical protein
MSTSRYAASWLRTRWVLLLFGVVTFLGSLQYLRGTAQSWTESAPGSGSPFIYKGTDVQDKVIVMAKIANQTVDWAYEGLKEFVLPGMVHYA